MINDPKQFEKTPSYKLTNKLDFFFVRQKLNKIHRFFLTRWWNLIKVVGGGKISI